MNRGRNGRGTQPATAFQISRPGMIATPIGLSPAIRPLDTGTVNASASRGRGPMVSSNSLRLSSGGSQAGEGQDGFARVKSASHTLG